MKKIMLRAGAIGGVVALMAFFVIVFCPNLTKTAPYNIIGAVCFFMFLLVGVPCIDLIANPNALVTTEHENHENDEE